MNISGIAWRNLRTHLVQTALAALVISVGVGMAIAVIVLSAGLRRGLVTAGGPFELVVGPKGSAMQLVVSSVLLQDVPIGNISHKDYEALAQDARVRDAVPIALGDNVAGLRVVGTSPRLFEIVPAPNQPPFYQLAKGRLFDSDFEVMPGSAAASKLGLNIGDELISSHGVLGGVNEGGHKSRPYQVVGVLMPTNTPADLGLYVSMNSYLEVHGIAGVEGVPQPDIHVGDDSHESGKTVTAILIRARDVSSAYQLYQQINASEDLQAALPGAVLTQFLDLLGQGQQILSLITAVALGMAVISTALALYGAVAARQRDIAVMRAIGAPRATVLGVVLTEALLLAAIGLALGVLLGYGVAAVMSNAIASQAALATPLHIEPSTFVIAGAMLLLGAVAGIAPAVLAYRVEPAHVLSQIA
jgi:putative ABC transport system permease protein